jgi:capsular exopolysaccharide synthesis family protein
MAAMEKRVDAQKKLAIDLNERATQYKIMEREVETNKGIYQSLLERSREIESMAGISSSTFHIVDLASIPLLPSKPNVRRSLLLAIVVGLMLGVGLAFFLEYFTDSITNPEEITDRFMIPILGVVPLTKNSDFPVEKTFIEDPRAPLSEAMRTTRVSLQLSSAGARSKSFVITSTRPGEGKTTLAANLALTFAGSGEKVVLVDADMRKPRIHKIFGENGNGSGPGLSTYLAGVGNKGILHKNGAANLHYVPAGPIPPNPVELLASKRFSQLIRLLEKHYDRVIVDGPPHQGFADILVLSQHLGGVVLLSSVGETTRDALRHFKKSISNVNGTILGCVINKVDLTKRYGYQSYYKYYSYYGYGGDKDAKRLAS